VIDMATELTWLGHGSWLISTGGYRVVLDPFLDESPTAPVKSEEVEANYILVSHGHFDHVADVASIAHRTGATVLSNFEIAQWFSQTKNVEKTIGMNLGGATQLPFGQVKLTLAHHSSVLPDGTNGGNPSGFLLTLKDGKVYFACDTALFLDMRLIGTAGIDLAVLPIGDFFTMGPDDSVEAVKFLRPKRVVPAHYNTFPPIEQDPHGWAERIKAHTSAEPIVLQPGGKITL
jgi:L-ascorbate metabolism protein UlaG (beta-lactamase superfamily)